MLELWKQAYLDVRKKIEQSGRDARWEFDRRRLFDRSDYIAQICSDIHNVAQVRNGHARYGLMADEQRFAIFPRQLKSFTISLGQS